MLSGHINVGSTVLPALVGVYLWRDSGQQIRTFTGFLIYGVCMSLLGGWWARVYGNNMVLFHIDTLLSYAIITWIMARLHGGSVQRLLAVSIPLYLITYGVMLLSGIESPDSPNRYTAVISHSLVSIWAMYTIYSISRAEDDPHHSFYFWLSYGVLISYGSTGFIYAGIAGMITPEIWIIRNILIVVANVLYFIGYLWLRNSISTSSLLARPS